MIPSKTIIVEIPDPFVWHCIYRSFNLPEIEDESEEYFESESEYDVPDPPLTSLLESEYPSVEVREKICSLSNPSLKRTFSEKEAMALSEQPEAEVADEDVKLVFDDQECDADRDLQSPSKKEASKDTRVNPGDALSCSCSTKPGGFWDLMR